MTDATLVGEAFALAFGTIGLEAALRLREGTAWRHFPAPDPDRYRPLCGIAALDAFLATAAARSPPVTMADSARASSAAVPPEEFTREDGRIDPPRLFRRFDGGATLVVSQFQDMHPPLARFCRGLERLFLHAVQANVYLTPAGAQGFKTHFDTHDVLVLQVQGEKHWRLFPTPSLPLPTRRTPWDRDLYPPVGEPEGVMLRPGDALYIPRGTLHDAAAQAAGEPSLHITVGLLDPVWADILHDAIDVLEPEDAALRESVRTWRFGEPGALPAMLREAAARLERLGDPALLERVTLRFLDGLAADRLALSGRGLVATPPGPDDRLRLAETVLQHVATGPDGGAALRWSGGVEMLSERELDWLQQLEEGATPAGLGEGALDFCHRLRANGLLVQLPAQD
jgi:hypothetical protein